MASVHRANRKATDQQILELNSFGLSLRAIGKELGCHHTTIKARLDALKATQADTRRAFMDQIYDRLTPKQRDCLAQELGPHFGIQDWILTQITSLTHEKESNDNNA